MSEQSALQSALAEHFSSPQPYATTATVDGVAVMGFSIDALAGIEDFLKQWLQAAIAAGLVPDKAEVLKLVGDAFDQYVAPTMGPIVGRFARMGLLTVVGTLYDAVVSA